MIRLALDTSTSVGSVAAGTAEGALAVRSLPVRAVHSETVLPAVVRLLDELGRSPSDVTEVVVGSGPGSFTGVRIAAALAKGFRFGRDVPLYAYSGLHALAVDAGLEEMVCALLDARRGEVYAGAYRRVVPPETELGPVALPVEELLDRLAPEAWSFVGEGALLHCDAIEARGGRAVAEAPATPSAAALLRLRERCPEAGRIADPAGWEPEYVRRSGAVRARVGKA